MRDDRPRKLKRAQRGKKMTALAKLQAGDNLNTAQALEWLAAQGIHTTSDGLRRARNAGRLPFLKV